MHSSGFQHMWPASTCLHRCILGREIPDWQLCQRSICNMKAYRQHRFFLLYLANCPNLLSPLVGSQNSVSAQWWMKVFACQPTIVCLCIWVYRRMLYMSFSLFLQQCPPVCLVCQTWRVCERGGKWLYSCCIVLCCFQDLFKYATKLFGKINPHLLRFWQFVEKENMQKF